MPVSHTSVGEPNSFNFDGMRVADALITASAVQSGAALMTANVRHYTCIPDITLEHYRP